MAASNQPAWFSNLPSAPSKTPEQVKRGQEITKGGIDIQTETAKAPYAGPQAETNLKKDRLQVIREAKTYGRDLRKEFDATEAVKTYREGMRYFTTALRTPPNSAGDQDLVTLAAKVQDPTGAVMQGDIERYNNIQVALERLPQAFRNEFLQTGKFSDKTRADIRRFITNRVLVQRDAYNDARKSYVADIEDFNAQTGELGVKPLDAATVLGTHPATLYKDKILAYDATQKAEDKVAERSGLMSAPEGMRVSGEDVKGFRFSPEAESSINAYTKSEGATAEGYAKMLADAAVKEGFIDEAQRGNYEAQTALDNAETFKLPPAQRGGIDYKAIDEAASKNAGLFETVAQAGRNLPESAAQLVTGLGGMIANPIDTIKTTADLAGALLQGDTEDPTVQAAAKVLEEQYGGVDNLQRYLIKDPLAFLGDASMLLSGSGFALKTAGLAKVGEGLSTAGRVIDPLSGVVSLATDVPAAAYQKAKANAPGAVQGLEDLPTEILGFPSGIGGAPIREAAGAGFERGVAGAPTPRSEAFTEAMREPELVGDDLVTKAREAVGNLRQQGSDTYTKLMAQFGKNPAPLDIQVVRDRMDKIKPRSYDTWSDRKGPRPAEHLAWEQMNNFVEDYAAKAAQDPNLLMPLEMDQFKQDIYDVGSKIGGAYDRDASRIAGNAYNAVRQELVRHDPIYAEAMRAYEKTAREVQQLETTFGLAVARGKQPNIESVTRKLQAAIGRNNANVSYGQRAGQAERLNELDPEGTITPTLAGTSVSSWKPRGLNAAVTLGAGIPAAYTNPLALLAAPAFMPRAVGEMAYGAGRLAGTGARAFDAITGSKVGQGLGAAGTGLAELYQKYPELFLAGTQAGTMLDKIDAQALADKYVGAPVVPAGDVAAEEQITVTGTRNPPQGLADLADSYGIAPAAVAATPETAPIPEKGLTMFGDKAVEYDPETDTYVELATGRRVKDLADLAMPVQGMYRGGTVRAFKNGGDKGEVADQSSYGANLLRQIGEGVSFGNAAETEALLRAGFLTPEYYALKKDLEDRRSGWAKQNPKAALAADVGGSLVPGVLGAFVPGPGWAATASTGARVASVLPRVARVLDAPAEALLRRTAPNALNAVRQSGLGRTAVTVADEVLNGALRSVGEAPTYSEILKQVKDDLAKNAAMSLGARTATSGGRRGVRFVAKKVRGK